MGEHISDTSPAGRAAQAEALRALSGTARLELAIEMSEMARELAAMKVRAAHPDWDSRRVARELARMAFAPHEPPAFIR